ncbi:MAG TPA: hypothetical protein VEX64_06075 [Pyrinomonadaceae bacterium]|jgi:hypothetical protein|nr:hypothetical protein [Pyrinomonadaceae bacterium]
MENKNDNNEQNQQNQQNQGRKEGDAKRNETEMHGEHTGRAPELGTNSLADKLPKGKVKSSGGGM